MLNKLTLATVIGTILLSHSVCANDLTVGFSQIGSESGWRAAETSVAKSEAEKRGITLKIADAQQLSIDQILIPCAIKSLAARKPSSLLCRASQPSQRAPQLAIPVRLLSIKPPSLAIAM